MFERMTSADHVVAVGAGRHTASGLRAAALHKNIHD